MTTTTYTNVVTTVTNTIRADESSKQKWLAAGNTVREFFKDAEAFRAVKKQFEADAIIPALDKTTQGWLSLEIKRGDKSDAAEAARKNKLTARGMVASYFSRIENYAFPKPKAETKPTDEVTAIVKAAISLARKGQKLESAPFDLIEFMRGVNIALKALNVTSETEID